MKQNGGGTLAQGLGWFSVALGAAELILPGGLAGLIGYAPGLIVVNA